MGMIGPLTLSVERNEYDIGAMTATITYATIRTGDTNRFKRPATSGEY
jgi:hypothetical protein